VHELEILLLLNNVASRECGTSEISPSLQIDRAVVEAVIKSLESRRPVLCRDARGERLYRIDSSDKAIVATLKELSE
jgi:hypothetical protein